MRSYYLPRREFLSAIVGVVYIPPSADVEVACNTIHSTVARLQTQHPNTFVAITGDFNHITLDKTWSTFYQYVNCPPPADLIKTWFCWHQSMSLLPKCSLYPQGLWGSGLRRLMRHCRTALMCFVSHTGRTSTACQTASQNTSNSVNTPPCWPGLYAASLTTSPGSPVTWKYLLKKKKAFRSKDGEKLRSVQHDLRVKLRECKDSYWRKLEASNSSRATRGMCGLEWRKSLHSTAWLRQECCTFILPCCSV